MATTTDARQVYYAMLCEVLYDDEARQAGIVTDATDVRVVMFLDEVWRDPYLRRWLCAPNRAGAPVSEPRFLNLLGWMQQHDYFADGLTKAKLAEYLAYHLPMVCDWRVVTLLKYLYEHTSPRVRDRLARLADR